MSPQRAIHRSGTGRRRSDVRDAEIVEAVRESGRWEHEGWAHPDVIAMKLGVSRSTAVRWCSSLAERGLLRSEVRHGWRYSKSVRSIRFWPERVGGPRP